MIINVKEETFTIDHNGATLRGHVSRYGHLLLYEKYRGESVSANSMADLKRYLEKADAEAAAKIAWYNKLKEAATKPLDGLVLSGHRLIPTKVRGVDQRSGSFLTTNQAGEKKSVDPRSLLRVLTTAEQAEFNAAFKAIADAEAAIPKAPTVEDVAPLPGIVLEAHYDFERDCWTLEYDSEVFTADSNSKLERAIQLHLLLKAGYSWRVFASEVRELRSDATFHIGGYWEVFQTEEEAENFAAKRRAHQTAKKALVDLSVLYQFDKSLLEA